MRRVGGIAAAGLIAAAAAGVGLDRALAEPVQGPEQQAQGPEQPRFLFFAGSDLWRHGGFAHGGLLWSPGGLDQDGFTFKVLVGGGLYQYVSGALDNAEVTGRELMGFAMPGWRFKHPGFELILSAGLDLQQHRLSPDDPTASLRGGYAGIRGSADLWLEPSAATMLAVNGSVSSIGPTYSVRAAMGVRLFDRFYVGPEGQAFDCDNYRQYRVGLHLTGLKMESFEWSAGVGWSQDTDDRSGVYGKLGVIARR
jgi:hypothetical protein